MNTLAGKVAIVTGASKGIGAGIANAFSAEGASVVVNYASSKAGADRVLAEIADAGGNAIAVQGSVSDPEDVKRLFAETKAAFGKLDILVNNAGVFKFEPFESISVAEFNREFSTNVLGPILTIQEAIKQFGFEGGRVINISSLAGSHSLPNGILYSATKAAVENLTQGLSAELGARRIRVNAIAGTKVVNNLRQTGHEVVAASPSSGVNTLTGEGLDDALAGTAIVVDVANSPSFEDSAVLHFFQTAGRNLLAAEQKAGVRHHVALSVVGTDRMLASGYFRGKMAQENLITASSIPYTIVRATQFFEFVGGIAHANTDGRTIRLSTALLQPIASDDVARAVSDAALAEPVNGIVEVAGPDKIGLDNLMRRFLKETNDPREVISDPKAPYFGAELNDQSLTPGEGVHIAATHFDEWLKTSAKK